MSISMPARKVCLYWLLMLGAALVLRLVNHLWPPVSLLGAVGSFSYYLWRKEQALEKRMREADAA